MRLSTLCTFALVKYALAAVISPATPTHQASNLITRGDKIKDLWKQGLLPTPDDVLWQRQMCAAPLDQYGRYKLCITCQNDGIRCAWNSMNPNERDISCWCARSPTGALNRIDVPRAGCWGGVMTDTQTCSFNPSEFETKNVEVCSRNSDWDDVVDVFTTLAGVFIGGQFNMPAERPKCPDRMLSDHFRYPGPDAGDCDDSELVAARRAADAAAKQAKEDAKRAKAAARAAEKQAKADAKKAKEEAKKAEKQRKEEEKKAEKQRKEEEKKAERQRKEEEKRAKKNNGKRDGEDALETETEAEPADGQLANLVHNATQPKASLRITRKDFSEIRARMAEQMNGRFMLLHFNPASQEFQPIYHANDTFKPHFTFKASDTPLQVLLSIRDQLHKANLGNGTTSAIAKRELVTKNMDVANLPALQFDHLSRKWQQRVHQ